MPTDSPTYVKDVMSTPLETISASASVEEAAAQMREHDINALCILGGSAGIITATDVLEAVVAGGELSDLEVSEVMTAPVERITTEEELPEAAAMMTNFNIKHLPVVDTHGDYVGMVSTTDLTTQLA